MKAYSYRLFNLKFESEFELPDLSLECFSDPDIKLKLGKNPDHLPTVRKKGVLFELTSDDFLFRIQNIGSYRVQNGNCITIEPKVNATISEISLFLFGSAMGALLHQRGILPLHGSAIKVNNECIPIIGHSSAGKSSLAAGFALIGYSILSDDISALSIMDNSKIFANPGLPFFKLWDDVLNYFESDMQLKRVRPNLKKYIKPMELEFHREPLEVKRIICIEKGNQKEFQHKIISGSDKFNLLINHIYRPQYMYGNKKRVDHFKQMTLLSQKVRLYRVERPESPLLVRELVSYIMDQIINR